MIKLWAYSFALCIILAFGERISANERWQVVLTRADSLNNSARADSAVMILTDLLEQVMHGSSERDSAVARVLNSLGRSYRGTHNYDSANSCLTQALEIRERVLPKDHPDIANTLLDLVDVLNLQGHHVEAIPLASRALSIRLKIYGEPHTEIIDALNSLARLLKNMGSYSESEHYLQEALAQTRAVHGETSEQFGLQLGKLAYLLMHREKYGESDSLFTQALEIFELLRGSENLHVTRLLQVKSVLYRRMGRFDEAIELCERDISTKRILDSTDDRGIAMSIGNLAVLYMDLGNHTKAESLLVQTLAMQHKLPDTLLSDLIPTLTWLADLYRLQGRFDEAEQRYNEALAISEIVIWPDNPIVGSALQSLAQMYLVQGRYEAALLALNRALGIYTKVFGRDCKEVGSVYTDLASVHFHLGSPLKAEESCRTALNTLQQIFGTEHQRIAQCLDKLAEILSGQGAVDSAISRLEQALRIRKRHYGEWHQETAANLTGLARLHHLRGDTTEAERMLRRSLDIYEKALGDEHPLVALSLDQLADLATDRNEPDQAAALRLRELSILETAYGPSHPRVTECTEKLALTYARLGQYHESIEYFRMFIESRRRFVRYLFSFSSNMQRLRWIGKYPLISDALLSAAVHFDDEHSERMAGEAILNGKATVLDAAMVDRRKAFCSLDESIESCLLEHSHTCSQIANLSFDKGFQMRPEVRSDSLMRLQLRADSLEALLSRKCSEFKDEVTAHQLDLDTVASAMPERAVLWELLGYKRYNVGNSNSESGVPVEDRYLAMVLKPSGVVELVDLGARSTIDKLVTEARSMIYDAGPHLRSPIMAILEHDLAEASAQLYQLVFAPLLAISGDVDIIYLSPDGALGLLPLGILVAPDNSYVIENYRLCYLTSGRDLLKSGLQSAHADRAAIVADPDFRSSASSFPEARYAHVSHASSIGFDYAFEPLRGIGDCLSSKFANLRFGGEEAYSIRQVLSESGFSSVDLYTAQRASVESLKSLIPAPDVLHIITHGFFCNGDPPSARSSVTNPLLLSGLALAGANQCFEGNQKGPTYGDDGILTALEVSTLDLSGCELAILSACESGVGEIVSGEGVFGLQRAFHHAGAKTVIMSLWRIPDQATSEIMISFYRKWQSGASKLDAIHESALGVLNAARRDRGHGHPVLWGGLVLAGRAE